MKQGKAVRKISGGKLIRIDTLYSDRLHTVKITGDFFLHPEEALEDMEHLLSNASLPLQKEALIQELHNTLTLFNAQMVGVSPEDIVSVLEEAVQ